jgi:hypothetical protein
MKSPFPGMDPYLEGSLWADVHQALAYQIRRQLVPLVEPTYVVRLAISMIPDQIPADEARAMYPDVNVVQVRELLEAYQIANRDTGIAPPTLTFELALPAMVPQVSVEVRDADFNKLITSIEILSPANKREPGMQAYLAKREELRKVHVHLLEIDLLRRGIRPWPDTPLPECAYLLTVIRAQHIRAEAWPIALQQPLPVIPVPLREPDDDVPLNLQDILALIYQEARYARTINYQRQPPPPALSSHDADWVAALVQVRNL